MFPTDPMCAMLAAVRREPKQVRQDAFGALAGMAVDPGVARPVVDRWLAALGIDVGTSIEGASSFGAMLDSLSSTSDQDQEVDAEALTLALTWAGRIGPDGDLPEAARFFAPQPCTLPAIETPVRPPSDTLEEAIDRRLLLNAGSRDARDRALSGAEAEAQEESAELHALYLTTMSNRDHRSALRAAQNASHTEIRRAYHERLDELDRVSTGVPGDNCLALELRARLDTARAQVLPAEPESLPSIPAVELLAADLQSDPPDTGPLEARDSLRAPPSAPPRAERRSSDAPQDLSEPPEPLSDPPEMLSAPPPSGPPPPPTTPTASTPPPVPTASLAPSLPPVLVTSGDGTSPMPADLLALTPASQPESSAPVLSAEDVAATDAILEQGNWRTLLDSLDGRDGQPDDLPAPHRLLYAIALKETSIDGAQATKRRSPEKMSIGALGEMMHVATDTATVRIVARRVLRRRPLQWQKPPPRGLTFVLAAIALVLGVGGGLLFTGEILELLWTVFFPDPGGQ